MNVRHQLKRTIYSGNCSENKSCINNKNSDFRRICVHNFARSAYTQAGNNCPVSGTTKILPVIVIVFKESGMTVQNN